VSTGLKKPKEIAIQPQPKQFFHSFRGNAVLESLLIFPACEAPAQTIWIRDGLELSVDFLGLPVSSGVCECHRERIARYGGLWGLKDHRRRRRSPILVIRRHPVNRASNPNICASVSE
jgi:hypothetical protein